MEYVKSNDDYARGYRHALGNAILNLEQISAKRSDIETAKQTLTDAGYYATNLWHVDDVTQNYDCTKEEAMRVLDGVLGSNHEDVYNSIDDAAINFNLKMIQYD